ncbi:MAG: hypothetical protein Q4A19_04720 [Johnsonella sp.]|nr:hypothetical protein [Johnsonella sp.]
MKEMYIFLKIAIIIILVYLFFNPDIFAIKGYALAIDGLVVCRGASLILAFNMVSGLLDRFDKK